MRIVTIHHHPQPEAEVYEVPDGSSISFDPEFGGTLDSTGPPTLFVSRPGQPGLSIELDTVDRVYINPYPGMLTPDHQVLFDATKH